MDRGLCLENSGYCWNKRYLSDTHRKLKLRKILVFINIHVICQIDLIFCIEHGGITAVLCAKSLIDWAIQKYARQKRDLERFQYKVHLDLTFYNATAPCNV